MSENWSIKNFTQSASDRWSTESFATGKPGPLDPRSITPSTYMQHAAERIQMYQTERDTAGSERMTTNEQVAIQDAYRELAGLDPTTYRRYKGGAVAIDRFAETRQARTEDSPWENFKANIANTVMQSAGGITALGAKATDTIGITNDAIEEWSNQLNETQRILAPRGGVSGLMGQVVGSTMFSLLAGGTGPVAGGRAWAHGLKVGGAFGLSTAGQSFAETAQRRLEGQDIGVLNEWTAAIGNGAIEAATEAFGWTIASRFATKLVRGAPGLRHALATQGWKGAQGWLGRGLKTSAGTVLAQLPQGYLEEFTAQIGQDATNIMTGITPEIDWSDLLGRAHQAGQAGALQPMLLGGGMAAGRLAQQQLHRDTTGLGDSGTAPQIAGPGMNIDPGEMGPATEVVEAPTAASETLTAAAYLNPATGEIHTGRVHAEAAQTVNRNLVSMSDLESGFVTDQGRFVTDEEGSAIARTAQQTLETAPETGLVSAEEIRMGQDITEWSAEGAVEPVALTREQIVDQMTETTPEAERSEITRAAFEANLQTLQHGDGPFVEIEVPIASLEVLQITEEKLGPEVAEYAARPGEEAPAIVAGTTAPGGRLSVIDGVHRVRAAQQRGDTTIKALIPQADAEAIARPVAEEAVEAPSFETWIVDQAGVTMQDLTEDPALRYEYEQEYRKQQVPAAVEAAATAQKTLRDELNVRIPSEQKLPAVDEQDLDGNWHTLTDTWIGDRQVAEKQADTDAQNKQRTLEDLAEKGESAQDVDRAIHLYIDMKNNAEAYSAERIAKRTSAQQADIFRAKNLTPAQQAFADQVIKENQALGLKGMEAGILASYHENYTARLWKFPKQQLSKRGAKFGTRTARAKPRVLDSILEGWERGFTLQVAGVVEAQQISRKQLAQVIHDRNLVAVASKAKLIDTEQHKDWMRIEHPNFKKWVYAGKVEEGKIYGRGVFLAPDGTVFRETPMYAEPQLARYLNNALGSSKLYTIPGVGEITKYNSIIKQAILMTGLFHHQAFLRSYMLASRGIDPKKAWQEGKKAVEEFGPELQLLVHEGLTYGLVQDFQLSVTQEQTAVGKAIDKVPMVKACKDLLLKIRDRQVHFLFGKMGPYLKVQAALLDYQARVKANAGKLVDGRISHREIAAAVAEELNNDFGGLNLQRMGRNPTTQHIFHLLALAPDWTESNIRSAVAAFQRDEIGVVHRQMWARIAVKGVGMVILSNLLLAGFDDDDFWTRYRKAWKTGNLRWLDVDVTPVYKTLGGKDRKRKYFNLLGHFRDPVRFAIHPVRAAKGKSSVLGRMAWESLSGTDWSGRGFTSISDLATKGKVTEERLFGKGPVRPTQIPSFLVWQGKQALPIQVQSMIDWQRGQIDGWDATLQSLGIAGGTTYPKKTKGLKRVSRKRKKR